MMIPIWLVWVLGIVSGLCVLYGLAIIVLYAWLGREFMMILSGIFGTGKREKRRW